MFFFRSVLRLDPVNDPLCVLLMIDFYAIRAEQYPFLIRLYTDWDGRRNLSQLPNFAFSYPLALFHQARKDEADTHLASEKVTPMSLLGGNYGGQ